MTQKTTEYSFIKAMVLDSDINGVNYFKQMLVLIKYSKLSEKQKSKLNTILEETSGFIE